MNRAAALAAAAGMLFFGACAAAKPSERSLLTDWAISRCVARAAAPQPFADDAKRSAAALLERGGSGVEIYQKIDAAIDRYRQQPATGSTGGSYAMLQCLEFSRDPALTAIIGPASGTTRHGPRR